MGKFLGWLAAWARQKFTAQATSEGLLAFRDGELLSLESIRSYPARDPIFCRNSKPLKGTFGRRALLSRIISICTLAVAGSFLGCDPPPSDPSCASESAQLSRHTNPIIQENAKPGDASWQLTNPAAGEIEGFASATSVNRGEAISFFVNTSDPTYDLEVFRMGWYGGAGARKMMSTVTRAGQRQLMPEPSADTGLIECQWDDPYVLKIPNDSGNSTDWASGVYLVKLTAASSGKQSYIIFTVRDDARASDLLFQSSVNTYQAYNSWGGNSLYTTSPRAYKVSFNRPYLRGNGAGDFLRWEYNMVRFLEREGYDVTYSTDVDTHSRGEQLLSHKGFLVVGHDEYWSWEMRENVEAAREAGVGLGFFAANTCFWQIRFESSPSTGDPNRTIVGYKEYALTQDPLAASSDPNDQRRVTTMWRKHPVNRPEDALVGVMYDWDLGTPNNDMVVENTSSWVFQGTGLAEGDHLPGLLGYETDRMFHHAPKWTRRVAHSPVFSPTKQETLYSDMTVYTTNACSVVAATGSMQWNWGLDDYSTDHPVLTNPAAQQITRNILKRFGALSGLPF